MVAFSYIRRMPEICSPMRDTPLAPVEFGTGGSGLAPEVIPQAAAGDAGAAKRW
jgi:hypothetical protein